MKSVHSNWQAPSCNIAHGFAGCNRIQHLVSRGFFLVDEAEVFDVTTAETQVERTIPNSRPVTGDIPPTKRSSFINSTGQVQSHDRGSHYQTLCRPLFSDSIKPCKYTKTVSSHVSIKNWPADGNLHRIIHTL